MAKLNILLTIDNSFRDKDEVLKDYLREQFDQEDDILKMEVIIEFALHCKLYQLAVEMQKDLITMPGYKVISLHGKEEIEGDHLFEASRIEEVANG